MGSLQTRTLGKSGVKVSAIGLGTVPLAGFGVGVEYDQFEKTAWSAYEQGIRHFDSAPMYGLGKAEHFLGHFLRTRNIRSEVVVSTKVGRLLTPVSRAKKGDVIFGINWVDSLPFVEEFDYSYDGIMRSFEDSQQRLGLDFIDILLVHDIGRLAHGDNNEIYWKQLVNGGFKALDELRRNGNTRAIGIGVNETDAVLEMSDEFDLDCCLLAGRYTLLNHEPLQYFFPACLRRNVSVIGAGVFNSGILAAGSRAAAKTYDYQAAPADVIAKVKAIEDVCEKYHVALPQAAVRFVHAHPAVSSLVLGAKDTNEVSQNVAAITASIPNEFWDELKERRIIPAEVPTPSVDGAKTAAPQSA
ncbi:aldo/keto reductase [Paraburkholderia caribensis]|uniref:aldo/keto reductase n=1 Tax=Paraburkholderia caribensis TaxID=75105 RepID=UPI00159086FD|nr:aldo/keto reductase [Paraburkholderia caribensis]